MSSITVPQTSDSAADQMQQGGRRGNESLEAGDENWAASSGTAEKTMSNATLGGEPEKTKMAVGWLEDDTGGGVEVTLTWRTWLAATAVYFMIFAQVFVQVAPASVIAFIGRDLGHLERAGWVVSGPLLVQGVLSVPVGRLALVVNKKYIVLGLYLVSCAGCVVSARAASMDVMVAGGLLLGLSMASISIINAIPAETLPYKFRPLTSGVAYSAGSLGGLLGTLAAGKTTGSPGHGWHFIYWIALVIDVVGLVLFCVCYRAPATEQKFRELPLGARIWFCDAAGSTMLISGSFLTLAALDWTSQYPWSDAHVAVCLALGLALLLAFAVYEWHFRTDGLVAHVLFRRNKNFALATLAFGLEGWIFFSAISTIMPQMTLNLGWASDSWSIWVRNSSFGFTNLSFAIILTWYASRRKDLKRPLLASWVLFMAGCVCYACVTPSSGWDRASYAINVVCGVGQAGPIALLLTYVQFTAPHRHLSTAVGFAFAARAVGGAFGVAVLNTVVNIRLAKSWAAAVADAAVAAGLPTSSLQALLTSIREGAVDDSAVVGATARVWAAALAASAAEYARAYRLAWWTIFPLAVLALAASAALRNVSHLMTDRVEATVERVEGRASDSKASDV